MSPLQFSYQCVFLFARKRKIIHSRMFFRFINSPAHVRFYHLGHSLVGSLKRLFSFVKVGFYVDNFPVVDSSKKDLFTEDSS